MNTLDPRHFHRPIWRFRQSLTGKIILQRKTIKVVRGSTQWDAHSQERWRDATKNDLTQFALDHAGVLTIIFK